ncbi:MAG: hypothetical protein HQK77_09340, partial [Desulfobacterales bacterium]|nr:hypothetical protein [Desulfobacterales bacterium]
MTFNKVFVYTRIKLMVLNGLGHLIFIGMIIICLIIPHPIFAEKEIDFDEDSSEVDELVLSMKNEMELITIATKSKQQKISQAPS